MTDLLERGARAVTRANDWRERSSPSMAAVWEEEAATLLSEHNAATPTEAPDAELPDGDEDIEEGVDQDDVDLPADPDAPGPWDAEDLT